MMSPHCAALVFYVCFLCAQLAWIEPFANGLSALPPSKNPDVLRSYTFGDKTRCWEVLFPITMQPEEEEDEVEYWYPTRKRHFEFSTSCSNTENAATATTIRQTSFGCGKHGADVWDSGIALCLYLGQNPSLVAEKRVLELGSGCGLPSVFCRDELGAKAVLATDFWEMETGDFDGDRLVPTKYHGLNLEYNVLNNNHNDYQSSFVQRLDWHDRDTAIESRNSFLPDTIIGSDLVYYPMDVEPLLSVLELLLVGSTRVVLALPLAPAEREALPEFQYKVQERFSQTHTVLLQERDLIRDDTEGENSVHLIVEIFPNFEF